MDEIDEQLDWFNISSQKYTEYMVLSKSEKQKEFSPRVYFIRQVKEEKKQGYIDVLNEQIFLSPSYINYFVLAEWKLKEEQLDVWFERNEKAERIKTEPFKINSGSISRTRDIL